MAAAGAAAAAAAKLRRDREEELMTQYSPNDIGDDWEFKIVRSNTATFRNPAALQKLIDEEARAGWVMLEKFDDSRVRFKRRRGARAAADLPPGYDPYRSHYGMSSSTFAALVVAGVFIFMAVIILIGVLAESGAAR